MAILNMAPGGPLSSHAPGSVNGDHIQSVGKSPNSTSPESSRSSRSHVSMKASSSTANIPSHMVNGTHSENMTSGIANPGPTRDLSILSSRPNGARAKQLKTLPRAKTELDLSTKATIEATEHPPEQSYVLRHGWEKEYNSTKYLEALNGVRIRAFLPTVGGSPIVANFQSTIDLLHVLQREASRN